MRCDIRKILKKLDVSINSTGVKLPISFIISDPINDFKKHERIIKLILNKLENDGFKKRFGPYIEMKVSDKKISIKKVKPLKLIRAIELRNEAEEKGKTISEIMTGNDRFLFLNEETVDNEDNLLLRARYYEDDIQGFIFKDMFKKDPKAFLKYVSEQIYSVSGKKRFKEEPLESDAIKMFGRNIVDIAIQMYPLDTLLSPENLPPIHPDC